mmetsp:Transcript_51096/g.141504  ORF Transcript_51096/g.141504 Transcript_51096/m.141504 type:complete len:245 (+) Transcript_51096:1228-1962(+)
MLATEAEAERSLGAAGRRASGRRVPGAHAPLRPAPRPPRQPRRCQPPRPPGPPPAPQRPVLRQRCLRAARRWHGRAPWLCRWWRYSCCRHSNAMHRPAPRLPAALPQSPGSRTRPSGLLPGPEPRGRCRQRLHRVCTSRAGLPSRRARRPSAATPPAQPRPQTRRGHACGVPRAPPRQPVPPPSRPRRRPAPGLQGAAGPGTARPRCPRGGPVLPVATSSRPRLQMPGSQQRCCCRHRPGAPGR